MTPLLAAGCLLQIVETQLSHDEHTWRERTVYEVGAEPVCAWIEVPLGPQAELLSIKGKAVLGDGQRRKFGEERFEERPRGADGAGAVRVHTPDLLGGDRAVVEVVRRWHRDELDWAPGGPRLALLDAPSDAQLTLHGDFERDRMLFAESPDPSWHVGIAPSAPMQVAPLPSAPPGGDVQRSRRLVLEVPRGNPQLLLYPGAGSVVRIDEFLTFPASTLPQGASVPVAEGQDIEVRVEPDGAATVERGPTWATVTVRPTEGPVRVALRWVEPDAPTYGERGDLTELIVDAPEGSVAWEGDGWRLVDLRKAPVLPSARLLVKALDHRFLSRSQPEPALPTDLRGGQPTWELAAALRPTVWDRASPAIPGDPLWPRKLVKARKSGVLTSTEAALILWLYARQAGLRADWALARPAHDGPGYASSPAGYRHGLVRLGGGDDVRWIDPSCRVCGPFELPPHLEGASVLSPGATSTPPPTEGSDALSQVEEGLRWRLVGPPALQLRLDMQSIPQAERGDAIAERVGGPGAALVEVEGLGTAGAPIVATVEPGEGLGYDPLALPPPGPDGTVWLDWVGTRAHRWQSDDDPGPAEVTAGPLTYRRVVTDGLIEEVLVVSERRIPAADALQVDVHRRGVR